MTHDAITLRLRRSLIAVLALAFTFAALAESETRFGIFADDGRLVGTGKIELESDDREAEVDLLRGFGGFVSVVVAVDGGFVSYDGVIGSDGALTVIVGGAFLDLRAFIATFGSGIELDLEYDDRIGGDPFRGDDDDDDDRDDDRRGRDDDDDDRDDDRRGRDDDDDDDDDDD